MKTNQKDYQDLHYSSPEEFDEVLKTISTRSKEELNELDKAMTKAKHDQNWTLFNAYQAIKFRFMQHMVVMSLSGCEL